MLNVNVNVKEPYGESGKFRLTQYILNPLTLTKSPPPHPSQTINDHRFLIDKLFFACCTKFPRNCFVLYNLSENWLFNMTELYKSTKEYFSRSAMLPQNVFWSLLFLFLLFFFGLYTSLPPVMFSIQTSLRHIQKFSVLFKLILIRTEWDKIDLGLC